jgi:hypothetical protein
MRLRGRERLGFYPRDHSRRKNVARTHLGFVFQFSQVSIQTDLRKVRVPKAKKRRRTIRERREIVDEMLLPGASVSRGAILRRFVGRGKPGCLPLGYRSRIQTSE